MARKKADKLRFENRFICYECAVSFKVFGIMTHKRNRMPFCPNCGENTDVKKEGTLKREKEKYTRLAWQDWEEALIPRYLKGELSPEQIRIMTGRTHNSVYGKIARAKEEQDKEQARNDKQCAI